MVDAIDDTPLPKPKKKGGWPKGTPRKPRENWVGKTDLPLKERVAEAADRAELRAKAPKSMLSKMKAAPNWESEDYVGVGQDYVDRLKIPDEIINALHADGIALQWVTRRVRGQETPQELSKMERGGWTPVHGGDFDGILDGLFTARGSEEEIGVEDCLLVARPTQIHAKSKMMERRQALAPVQIVEQQLGRGLPVSGGNHPTATRGNHISRTVERIDIPQ